MPVYYKEIDSLLPEKEKLLEDVKAFTKHMIEIGRSVQQHAILLSKDKSYFAGLHWVTDKEKAHLRRELQGLVRKVNAEEIVLVFETWYTSVEKDDKVSLARIQEEGVRSRLDKKEAIAITHSTSKGTKNILIPFTREKDKINFEEEYVTTDAEMVCEWTKGMWDHKLSEEEKDWSKYDNLMNPKTIH